MKPIKYFEDFHISVGGSYSNMSNVVLLGRELKGKEKEQWVKKELEL